MAKKNSKQKVLGKCTVGGPLSGINGIITVTGVKTLIIGIGVITPFKTDFWAHFVGSKHILIVHEASGYEDVPVYM